MPETKDQMKGNLMPKLILLPMMLLALATPALAQEDIQLKPPEAGLHTFHAKLLSNEPLSALCFDRVDVDPVEELLCIPVPVFAVGTVLEIQLLIPVTPGDNAEIRGAAIDMMGNREGYSENAVIRDFTAPSNPVFVVDPSDDGGTPTVTK